MGERHLDPREEQLDEYEQRVREAQAAEGEAADEKWQAIREDLDRKEAALWDEKLLETHPELWQVYVASPGSPLRNAQVIAMLTWQQVRKERERLDRIQRAVTELGVDAGVWEEPC